jgi:hypothetical protein
MKITVIWRRSATGFGGEVTTEVGEAEASRGPARNAAMAASNLRRWPIEMTPFPISCTRSCCGVSQLPTPDEDWMMPFDECPAVSSEAMEFLRRVVVADGVSC